MSRHQTRPARGRTSQYKGVYLAHGNRWSAGLYLPGDSSLYLGTFNSELEAARAYDYAALALLGPSAFLNLRDLQRNTQPVIDGDSARVPTSCGLYFTIDLEDLPMVRQYYWNIRKGCLRGTRARRTTQLHPLIMGSFPSNLVAIHINGDPLDCRKANIILAPRSLHVGRHRKRPGASSIYKGVRKTLAGTWSASLAQRHLGTFGSEVEAAHAYDEAARKRFGICAALNFPREGEVSCHRQDPASLPLAA